MGVNLCTDCHQYFDGAGLGARRCDDCRDRRAQRADAALKRVAARPPRMTVADGWRELSEQQAIINRETLTRAGFSTAAHR